MLIARGDADGVIRGILRSEEIGTLFPAREAHLKTRKSWLAFGKHLLSFQELTYLQLMKLKL